jgi:hypothetical protein
MSVRLHSESRIRRLRKAVAISAALIALAVTARAWLAPAIISGIPTPKRIHGELITIQPFGFEPTAIKRSHQPFFIIVHNRSGLETVRLRLSRLAGSGLKEAHLPKEKLNWSDLIDLPPGEYVLTEADHPDWACRITITAQ